MKWVPPNSMVSNAAPRQPRAPNPHEVPSSVETMAHWYRTDSGRHPRPRQPDLASSLPASSASTHSKPARVCARAFGECKPREPVEGLGIVRVGPEQPLVHGAGVGQPVLAARDTCRPEQGRPRSRIVRQDAS